MPIIQLNFKNQINVSVQIGDIAYFTNPHPVGVPAKHAGTTTPHMTASQAEIIKIGIITNVIHSGITCDMEQDLFNLHYGSSCGEFNCLEKDSFIMFSKDNKANMSSILGYYASAQFRNSSTEEAELFNVGVDLFESSK